LEAKKKNSAHPPSTITYRYKKIKTVYARYGTAIAHIRQKQKWDANLMMKQSNLEQRTEERELPSHGLKEGAAATI
jgi:hypothetical protein